MSRACVPASMAPWQLAGYLPCFCLPVEFYRRVRGHSDAAKQKRQELLYPVG